MKNVNLAGAIIVSRLDGMIEAEVDGELIGLHVDKGSCYGFNATATRIWELIAQSRTIDELCDILVAEFEVARSTCEEDVCEILRTLQGEGLVTLTVP